MLGSTAEADDAVQDAWLRLSRSDTAAIDNVGAWLTTVVARIALDRLRSSQARREGTTATRLPDPIVELEAEPDPAPGPEAQAVLADSIGLAMLVVLEQLSPPERLAFVLHDTFGLAFDEIAPIVERTPTATRQLASRARRRVRGGGPASAAGTSARVSRRRQRELVDAFLAAARGGDFDALVRILDPEVVVRADFGTLGAFGSGRVPTEFHGPSEAARGALAFRHLAGGARRATVSGAPGFVVYNQDRPYAILAFAFRSDRIVEIDVLGDPERLALLDLAERPA